MKTIETKPQASLQWHHFDGAGERLGRLATQVAIILQGKHKPEYSRYLANGDAVVITNCAEIVCTSKDKRYDWIQIPRWYQVSALHKDEGKTSFTCGHDGCEKNALKDL